MTEIVEVQTLITEDYFKAYSPIPDNYNIKELKPYFHIAEKLWIEPIIGTPLYEELLDEVEQDNVTPENATLLLNIYPLEAFAIVYEALPFVGYHLSQVGITKGKSDNSESVSINDVNYISTQIRNQCETMKSLLKKFLDEHSDSYPLYYTDDTDCDCECEDECGWDWIYEYYTNGAYDKYEWQRAVAGHRMKKFKPQSYNQMYSTRRHGINIQ